MGSVKSSGFVKKEGAWVLGDTEKLWEPEEEKAGGIYWWMSGFLLKEENSWLQGVLKQMFLKMQTMGTLHSFGLCLREGKVIFKKDNLVDRGNNGIKWGFVFVFKHIRNRKKINEDTRSQKKKLNVVEVLEKKQICLRTQVDGFGDPKLAL